jgi:hypothetical protein
MKWIKPLTVFLALSACLLAGCTTRVPKEALSLSPQSIKTRQLQTRYFDTNDEKNIISSCNAVLQDLGFNLDESETDLGVLVASKQRDATNVGQIIGSVFLALLTGVSSPVDDEQTIRVCLVTCPCGENFERVSVRVTFQRIIFDTQGKISRREGVIDAKVYQGFFNKLSQAVFLEAHEI